MKFKHLALGEPLLRAVADAGYKVPSPIQEKAIPPVLAGRDLMGCAQTGTGKTAAFALPVLQRLANAEPSAGKRPVRALVLTPTRELALQIFESFETYNKYLGLRCAVVFGGVGQQPQVDALRRGVDILVATPGRLLDLVQQGHIQLGQVEIFVLDEADRMLDMGFVNDVKKVIRQLPKKRQTLLFSATLPKEITQLADRLLKKPAKIMVTPVSSTVDKIRQFVYKVDKKNKRHLLAHLLKEENAQSALVFTRTKHGADRVARDLVRDGIKAKAIHGDKSQGARQDALARLKDGRIRVLVATDIAARGLDINELSHVFNYDLPNIPETYVHRIGRTGRAGRGGVAVSFCMEEELPYLADIEKLIGFSVPEVTDHSWQPKSQEVQMKEQAKPKWPAGKKKPGGAPEAPGKPAKEAAGRNAPKQKKGGNEPRKNAGRNPRGGKPPVNDSYEKMGIVTKRPVWGSEGSSTPASEGDKPMSKGRRRGGKGRGKNKQQPANNEKQAQKNALDIPKDKNGVFNFSDEELAKDDSLRLIGSEDRGEAKYASFEDFLKDR